MPASAPNGTPPKKTPAAIYETGQGQSWGKYQDDSLLGPVFQLKDTCMNTEIISTKNRIQALRLMRVYGLIRAHAHARAMLIWRAG